MEFRAAAVDWMDRVDLLICERDYTTNKIGAIAKRVDLVMVPHVPGSLVSESTLSLAATEAVNLMNALWGAGVRPSDFKSPNGEINRLEAHLADMRKIVFEPSSTAAALPDTKEKP